MNLIDYEGTVVPSIMTRTDQMPSGFSEALNVPSIMTGRVIAVYPPGDSKNISKTHYEYDVAAERRGDGGLVSRVVLSRCRVATVFGGVADYDVWSPRKEDNTFDKLEAGLGAQVIVALSNGYAQDGLIVGGVPHNKTTEPIADEGVFWRRHFNGVDMGVNKDGEFTVRFGGATDAKGSLTGDAGASGSILTLAKDGSIKIATNSEQQILKLNHSTKKIEIKADHSWDINVTGTWNATTGGAVKFDTKAALTAFTVNAPVGMIHLNSSIGTKLGAGTNQMMLGTVYRTAEITKNAAHTAGFTTLASMLAAAGGAITAASGILQAVSVLHKIPVAGAVLGSIPLQAAAAALTAAGGVLTAMGPVVAANIVAPLVTFEGAAPSYLSLKNSLD